MAAQDRPNQNANTRKAEGELRPADQSSAQAQSASAVAKGQDPELSRERQPDDVLNRNHEERYETPRRYEQDDAAAGGVGNEDR